jgi:hypothetical protein
VQLCDILCDPLCLPAVQAGLNDLGLNPDASIGAGNEGHKGMRICTLTAFSTDSFLFIEVLTQKGIIASFDILL